MPATYTLIASNTLTSTSASVTFSSIPGTYTDLVLKWSIRDTVSRAFANRPLIQFNGDTATNYSYTYVEGRGSSGAFSSFGSSVAELTSVYGADGSLATASTFSNGEFYIPSYTASQNKPMSTFTVQENNDTVARLSAIANLWRNTAAITSILLSAETAFDTNSSFFLYGISSS